MPKGCRAIGDLCGKSTDCCLGGTDSCRADSNGTLRCLGPSAGATCLPEGLPCSVAAQCCGGRCLPETTGTLTLTLTCASTCAPFGAPCVALEDCCAGVCLGPAGARVCTQLTGPTVGPTCTTTGDACGDDAASCCAGTGCASLTSGGTACVAF
jgi:hypothetical protein